MYKVRGGCNTVVDIAACYGLDGLSLNTSGGKILLPIHTGSEANPASCTVDTGSLSQEKSSQGMPLMAHLHIAPSWPVTGRKFCGRWGVC